jgi:hypothetical protein
MGRANSQNLIGQSAWQFPRKHISKRTYWNTQEESVMEPKDYVNHRSFQIGFVDVLGGACFGCLLTLAFRDPINIPQKAALGLFSIIMPIFGMLRLQMCELGTNPNEDEREQIKTRARLLRIVVIPFSAGILLFVWGIWSVAACLAMVSCILCVAVTYHGWNKRNGERNRQRSVP